MGLGINASFPQPVQIHTRLSSTPPSTPRGQPLHPMSEARSSTSSLPPSLPPSSSSSLPPRSRKQKPVAMLPFLLLSTLATCTLPLVVRAQDFTSNATSLTGTWSTGSGAVVTGPVRCVLLSLYLSCFELHLWSCLGGRGMKEGACGLSGRSLARRVDAGKVEGREIGGGDVLPHSAHRAGAGVSAQRGVDERGRRRCLTSRASEAPVAFGVVDRWRVGVG